MLRKFIFAGVIVAVSAGSAAAADLVESDPVPAADPFVDWSGWFAGVHACYGDGDTDFNLVGFGTGLTTDIEGDIAYCGIDGSTPCPNVAFNCVSKLEWLGTLRARVCGTFGNTGNTLDYVTGGPPSQRIATPRSALQKSV